LNLQRQRWNSLERFSKWKEIFYCQNALGYSPLTALAAGVVTHDQGCQIFLGPNYQNGIKYTKCPQNIPNGHKIFPMAIK
jgi:hypothetical protein